MREVSRVIAELDEVTRQFNVGMQMGATNAELLELVEKAIPLMERLVLIDRSPGELIGALVGMDRKRTELKEKIG
jgi:hypothetical protein